MSVVLSGRSSVYDVTIEHLHDSLDIPDIQEISLNELRVNDLEWIASLFNAFGFWGDRASWSSTRKVNYLRRKCRSQFNAILLDLMESPQIIERLAEVSKVIHSQRQYVKPIVSVLVLSVIGTRPTIDILYELWGETILKLRFSREHAVREILDFDGEEVRLRSSVAGRFLLTRVTDTNIVLDTLIELYYRSNKLARSSDIYQSLRVELIRFANIQNVLPEKNRRSTIIRFYESIRNYPESQRHPLFWLQYAIACLTIRDFERAKKYFDTAYSLAEDRGWNLVQINNHYARYLLENSIEQGDINTCMLSFREARNILHRQISEEDRHYPYRVATLYRNFYEKFRDRLGRADLNEVRAAALFVLEKTQRVSSEMRSNRYVRKCEEEMLYICQRSEVLLESDVKESENCISNSSDE